MITRSKQELIQAFNDLKIPGMPAVAELYELKGDYINLEYTLPSGQKAKLWEDEKTYYGAQLCKPDGDGRCFGLTADDDHLLVCEYGDAGADPEIILFKKL